MTFTRTTLGATLVKMSSAGLAACAGAAWGAGVLTGGGSALSAGSGSAD
jgi:hypothetical protein